MPEYHVADVDDLRDGEMKEVLAGTAKVLLSKIHGEFYATSHLCTHYKAPLVKGTISSDGRVMCPWHGACFNVTTGDIEDAPAVDGLASFTTIVRGSKVFIDATIEQIKVGRKKGKCVKSKSNECVVIIGGGAGGFQAAETLRTKGFDGKITVISRETYLPIDRPKLSKSLKIEASRISLRSAQEFEDLGIQFLLGKSVTAIDIKERKVAYCDEKSVLSYMKYDHLIVATGGDPRILPFPGKDLENIFVMRSVDDTLKLELALATIKDKKPNVVIVGSSFIGMEAASILSKVANVTVIGMEKVPFERVLGKDIGNAMMELNAFHGVNLRMETFVEKYESAANEPTRIGFVVLKGGEKLPADIVILGAGVIPKTDFLASSGFTIDKDGGVSVDEFMGIPGQKNIYAVGDISRYPYHITKENVRVEHWNVAENQGRIAALSIMSRIAGKEPENPFVQIPYFWTVLFGKSIRYVGHATSFDETIAQGTFKVDSNGSGLNFAVFYIRKGKVVAVCSHGRDPLVSHASELMRLGMMPSVEEIRDGVDLLSIPLESSAIFIAPKKLDNVGLLSNSLAPSATYTAPKKDQVEKRTTTEGIIAIVLLSVMIAVVSYLNA